MAILARINPSVLIHDPGVGLQTSWANHRKLGYVNDHSGGFIFYIKV